ncbi:MAG: dihydrofolate reductase family protein [Candidatus Binataceae bacterium]
MRKLVAFNQVSLDGYFSGTDGDFSWAKTDSDAEFDAFVAGNAKSGGVLIFGRVTYELMASYWPTPVALKNDPVVAERMNHLQKIVFSKTLAQASWNNTRLVRGALATEVRKLKSEPGEDMAILGSGSIIAQLAPEHLIDEFQIVVVPIALGGGRTIFDGVTAKLSLKLTSSRTFRNGKVLLCYQPAA